jgi:hypothetical protein
MRKSTDRWRRCHIGADRNCRRFFRGVVELLSGRSTIIIQTYDTVICDRNRNNKSLHGQREETFSQIECWDRFVPVMESSEVDELAIECVERSALSPLMNKIHELCHAAGITLLNPFHPPLGSS